MSKVTIDFVSDVACPWCAVGLGGLLTAMERVKGEADVELRFRPFELNPDMPKGCLLYTSPSPRDVEESRMPSSA